MSRPRRLLVVLAASSVLLIGLTACGDETTPAAAPSPSASSSGEASPSESESSPEPVAGGLPTVKGAFGEPPTISVPDGAPPEELVVTTLSEGDGPAVKAGQVIVVDYLGVRWEDGETFDSLALRGEVLADASTHRCR